MFKRLRESINVLARAVCHLAAVVEKPDGSECATKADLDQMEKRLADLIREGSSTSPQVEINVGPVKEQHETKQ